jgi:hypothetical protein
MTERAWNLTRFFVRVLVTPLAAFGCTKQPDSLPASEPATDTTPDTADTADEALIRYRELSQQDFKASQLPENSSPYAKKIGAVTCARISTTPDTGFVSREIRDPSGEPSVEARFERLGFMALMDRTCSWWNPNDALPIDYVLQHEQIHFAITELGARRLHASAPEIVDSFSGTAATHEQARAAIKAELERLIRGAMEEVSKRHRDFDEDTSGKYDPEAQAQWFETVLQELKASAP